LPAYQGRGYGSQVVSKLTQLALQTSKFVTLTVRADNAPAIRLYAKHGFAHADERLWANVGPNVAPSSA
jgi:ribosomal protein S18 acetylase RimI-like enzyme